MTGYDKDLLRAQQKIGNEMEKARKAREVQHAEQMLLLSDLVSATANEGWYGPEHKAIARRAQETLGMDINV